MNDTLDCSNSLQPCNCTANQVCIQIARSGTECARNTCVDRNTSKGSGGGSSIGALAGQAVGGVVGGILVLVAAYYLWRRRRRNHTRMHGGYPRSAKSPGSARSPNNPLKEFRIGGNKGEKGANDPVAGPPGEGEEDATPVKRQSLRFDADNNPIVNRRSISGTANTSGLPLPPGITDNPFGDHHSLDGNNSHATLPTSSSSQDGANGIRERDRESQATISEFSFRSSHSTNIIPIAYIPAHSTSNSIADLTSGPNEAYGQMAGKNARGSSSATSTGFRNTIGYGDGLASSSSSANPADKPRGSRLSVPFSLRSSTGGMTTDGRSGGGTFSSLFDRRASASGRSGGNGLEIIAGASGAGGSGSSTLNPSSTSPTSPSMLTPTTMYTKDGKPIRPPRAPGLDLKLPTPEPKTSPTAFATASSPPPPTSPSFPWNQQHASAAPSGILQAQQAAGRPVSGMTNDTSGMGTMSYLLAPPGSANSLAPGHAASSSSHNSTSTGMVSQRETLLSPHADARASAYSNFSTTTGSTGSHLSYILDPPQIVTPVSAGRVEVQVLGRAAAKTVKLQPGNAQSNTFPPHSHASTTPSPLSRSNTLLAREGGSSPLSDNPFGDDAAVRIEMDQHQAHQQAVTLPLTPTFGQSPLQTPGYTGVGEDGNRADLASRASTRRDSDLSIFTSSSAQGHGDSARNSFAQNPSRTPSGLSTTSPTGTSHSAATAEVILDPPKRPFVLSYSGSEQGIPGGADSRHTSAALSMRSGYASVLDGIPFNLSLSPEARHSQASTTVGGGGGERNSSNGHASLQLGGLANKSDHLGAAGHTNPRDSSATTFTTSSDVHSRSGSDKRDTSYSLASEWNGAFAGMPIVMGGLGSSEEAVPELPSQYKRDTLNHGEQPQQQDNTHTGHTSARDGLTQSKNNDDDRYSTDSLAMAAAVARSFGDQN